MELYKGNTRDITNDSRERVRYVSEVCYIVDLLIRLWTAKLFGPLSYIVIPIEIRLNYMSQTFEICMFCQRKVDLIFQRSCFFNATNVYHVTSLKE